MATLDLHFDFISPYAYLAYPEVVAMAERNDVTLRLRPTLFAALLDAHGHKGPAEIPSKRIYVFKHVLRLAHAAGVPLTPPPTHPFNSLMALRLAGLDMPEVARLELVQRMFDATWGGGPGVTDSDVLSGLCDACGLDGAAMIGAATQPGAKARLRHDTELALSRGVFGVPTAFIHDELFWGVEALGQLEAFIQGRDPLDREALARWADLPAGAVRPAARG